MHPGMAVAALPPSCRVAEPRTADHSACMIGVTAAHLEGPAAVRHLRGPHPLQSCRNQVRVQARGSDLQVSRQQKLLCETTARLTGASTNVHLSEHHRSWRCGCGCVHGLVRAACTAPAHDKLSTFATTVSCQTCMTHLTSAWQRHTGGQNMDKHVWPTAACTHLGHPHLLAGQHAGRRHACGVRRRRPPLEHLRPHACTSPHAVLNCWYRPSSQMSLPCRPHAVRGWICLPNWSARWL